MSSEKSAGPTSVVTRPVVVGALLLVLVAVILLANDYLRARHVELSEMPERQTAGLVLEPAISEFHADLVIPYGTLNRLVNDAMQAQLKTYGGRERIGCLKIWPVIDECLDFNWDATPSIPTPVTFENDGNGLVRVNLSGAVDGGGGFGGGLAGILGLDRKNLDAAFKASVATRIAIDENFCPVFTPGEVEFGWTKEARIELIGRSDLPFGGSIGPYSLDFGRHFNGPIRDGLKSAVSGASIDCGKIRESLEPLWRTYSAPVEIENAPPLHVNIDPEALHVSGIEGLPEGIRTAISVRARVAVETEKGEEVAKSEPLRNSGPIADTGSVNLAVPLKVAYDMLEQTILDAVGKAPIVVSDGGRATAITISALDIYPAGERLALGVAFSADLPWRLFDTSGTIWITARPVSEESGTVLRLAELAVTRQIDSPFWNALTAGFTDVLLDRFEDDAQYGLAGVFAQAADELTAALADPAKTGGVRFTLAEPRFYLGRIVPEDDRLAVEGGFETRMQADLSDLQLAAK